MTGFLGPERRRQDHHAADAARPGRADLRAATINGERYPRWPGRCGRSGAALEASSFHPAHTGLQHLRIYCAAAGLPAKRADEVLDLVGLAGAAKKKTKGYSMGMRQRLGLAATLLGDPQVLILDEPANGLDPEGIRWLRGFFRHLAGEGRTVLVSSHQLAEVQEVADRAVILNRGGWSGPARIAELSAGTATAVVRGPELAPLQQALQPAPVSPAPPSRTARCGSVPTSLPTSVTSPSSTTWNCTSSRLEEFDLERLFFSLTEGEHRGADLDRTRSTSRGRPTSSPGRPATGQHGWSSDDQPDPLRGPQDPQHPGLVLDVGAVVAFTALVHHRQRGASSDRRPRQRRRSTTTRCSPVSRAAGVALLVLGLLGLTTEFRHKTITPTLLATPNRWRLLIGKAASYVVFAIVYGLVCVVAQLRDRDHLPAAEDVAGQLRPRSAGRHRQGVPVAGAARVVRPRPGRAGAQPGGGHGHRHRVPLHPQYSAQPHPWVRKAYPYDPGGALNAFNSNGHRPAGRTTCTSCRRWPADCCSWPGALVHAGRRRLLQPEPRHQLSGRPAGCEQPHRISPAGCRIGAALGLSGAA